MTRGSSTLLKSIRIVEYLAAESEPRGITQITDALKIEKSAVQRILYTLSQAGYVEQDGGSRKYKMSLLLWSLGSGIIARHPALRVVHSMIRMASQKTGYTVIATKLLYPHFIYLEKVEGLKGHLLSISLGETMPLLRTAGGLAIAAYLPPQVLASLPRDHLPIGREPETLEGAIRAIRRRGYATTEGAIRTNVNSLAVPVWWQSTEPFGSIIFTAEDGAMPQDSYAPLAEYAQYVGTEITNALGGDKYRRACLNQFG